MQQFYVSIKQTLIRVFPVPSVEFSKIEILPDVQAKEHIIYVNTDNGRVKSNSVIAMILFTQTNTYYSLFCLEE